MCRWFHHYPAFHTDKLFILQAGHCSRSRTSDCGLELEASPLCYCSLALHSSKHMIPVIFFQVTSQWLCWSEDSGRKFSSSTQGTHPNQCRGCRTLASGQIQNDVSEHINIHIAVRSWKDLDVSQPYCIF